MIWLKWSLSRVAKQLKIFNIPMSLNDRAGMAILFAVFFQLVLVAHDVKAQSLTDQLIKQPAEQLVKEAKKNGDIVRGAILFHQGNINCARCHRNANEKNPIGPNLSQLGDDVKDVDIVTSILQPSKEIRKGYETQIILTQDGRTITGTIAEQDATKIVLYDKQRVGELITVSRNQIDDSTVSDQSLMPQDLVQQLKNRQQFLDLLRYTLELRGQNGQTNATGQATTQRRLADQLAGLNAIAKYSCGSCHETTKKIRGPKQGPNLRWSAANLNPEYLHAHVQDPQGTKPGTSMPSMMDHLKPDQRRRAADHLTHFLVSTSDNKYQTEAIDPASAQRGSTLFGSVGCVACHSPRSNSADELAIEDSIPLGNLSQKYNVTALREFLLDPLAVRPSGHMPGMGLDFKQASEIANFLLQKQTVARKTFEVDATKAKIGKQFFSELRCANCHSGILDATGNEKLPIADSRIELACMEQDSTSEKNHPRFSFQGTERQDILTALQMDQTVSFEANQLIDAELTYYNCVACHERDGLGGVSSVRNPHFQTTNLTSVIKDDYLRHLAMLEANLNRPGFVMCWCLESRFAPI